MLQSYFPLEIFNAVSHLNFNKLNEIRLRVGKPIVIDYGGLYYLSKNGITDVISQSLICTKDMTNEIINKACENSLYAYNEEIKNGYLTLSGGARIGIAGTCVYDGANIKTIKNFSSLNIRIPHEVRNCSLNIIEFLAEPYIHNTLILSPPGAGKTTLLRDIAYQFSQKYLKSVLIIDERNEIANVNNGIPQYNLGILSDVITNSTKRFGLENGIRSLNPNIVFTDELSNEMDVDAIHYALGCGVKVVATTHSENIYSIKEKKYFEDLVNKKIFERFVVLSTRNGVGTIEGVYDKNFKCLCM